MPEQFCLKNSSFSSSLCSSLSSLLATSSLCDCSLICSDGQLSAHKVILAATSSFFSSVFSLNHHNHPLIYLRGVKTDQVQAVLDFLYSGVANVAEDDVEDFLALANDLKIEGLMVKYKKLANSKKRKATKRAIDNEEVKNEDVKDAETSEVCMVTYEKPTNSKKRKAISNAEVKNKQEHNNFTNEDMEDVDTPKEITALSLKYTHHLVPMDGEA